MAGHEAERLFGQKIFFMLRVYLLHDFLDLKLNSSQKMLLLNLCLVASVLIVAKWKSAEAPSKHYWLDKARFIFLMGKLSVVVKYRQGHYIAFDLFKKWWAPFFQYYSQETRDFVKISHTLDML